MSAPPTSSAGPEVRPFGFWDSDWSAQRAVAASRDFAELRCGPDGLFWTLFDPADGRTTLWRWLDGEAHCLTPAGFSLRSRVYEYGGGAFCLVPGGVVFVNEADQQLYHQRLHGRPTRLTDRAGCRYGDLECAAGQVLAVEEDGQRHRLVAIALDDGQCRELAAGADFYAAPRLSADGQCLAWIEWDRPHQPWTSTRLCRRHRSGDGWSAPDILAGADGGESLQQPRFDDRGRLHCLSDRHGWWQPWRLDGEGLRPLPAALADHAPAPWQLGLSSHLPEVGLRSWLADGQGFLSGTSGVPLATDFSRFRQLAADDRHYYCIAAGPARSSAVLAIERQGGGVRTLAGGEAPESAVSRPRALRFPVAAGEWAHAFFHAPCNPRFQGGRGERPPLLVFCHGGPTSACQPVLDPRIPFWTQRGFAVADLDYRGSSGYGRAYRQRLEGAWGELDVADAAALVKHLAALGLVDPGRAFIRGASAGGFTTLLALMGDTPFRGGASYYGVSDPLALRATTHKFEADYLDWLIGDPVRDAARYRQRSAVSRAGEIEAPLILFQGGQDAVVVPEQTASLVAALEASGRTVACHVYPDERHGFRNAVNLAHALEAELAFYRGLLG
ncbi:alpha/beta hydrolase family protein [Metapseudomonas furukawaii]|uniref:Acylaminoacyl-peptidase family n=1 Tax=Metapseudomonas furukawaii TaxID=1149133 RepID=A0AAD1C0Y1_METFU|nr:prolyl oligopeptidase family serine peptidase [Pseudomonas furukawaii]ELS28397.1 Coenzyme PQQ synthesis protein F [Pseudomonas furukawaii]BAU74556.1 acylaminoacyl-peptidase family [Pseudomonas furukawaii]